MFLLVGFRATLPKLFNFFIVCLVISALPLSDLMLGLCFSAKLAFIVSLLCPIAETLLSLTLGLPTSLVLSSFIYSVIA